MHRDWRKSHFVYLDVAGSVHGETDSVKLFLYKIWNSPVGNIFQFFLTLKPSFVI
jgi:hypothetical protein